MTLKAGQIVKAKNYNNCYTEILSKADDISTLVDNFYYIDGTNDPQHENELELVEISEDAVKNTKNLVQTLFSLSHEEVNYAMAELCNNIFYRDGIDCPEIKRIHPNDEYENVDLIINSLLDGNKHENEYATQLLLEKINYFHKK